MNTDDLALAAADQLAGLGLRVHPRDDGLWATAPGGGAPPLHVRVHSGSGPVPAATVERWRREEEGAANSHGDGPPAVTMIAQPHITRALSRRYQAMGLPYVDASGNCWIRRWPMVIHVEGRPRADLLGPAAAGRAYAPAGLRLVFILLVRPALVDAPTRLMARAARISTGSAHNTLTQLTSDGFLSTGGSTHLLRLPHLTELWLAGYATRLAPKLTTKRLAGPGPEWWVPTHLDPSWDGQLGGESALAARGVGLRPGTATVYGEPPWGAVRAGARLGAPQKEGDVLELRQRFWDPDFLDDGPLVPDLLTYADATSSTSSRVHEAASTLWETSDELRTLRG